jgi:hypothetical protein
MRQLGVVIVLVVLCCCSTQHEVKEFPPFFRTDPSGYFNASYTYERQELESRTDLTPWEARRLLDLYELELRQVGKDTSRYSALLASQQWLSEKTAALADRVETLKRTLSTRENKEASDSDPVFVDPEFKKEYLAAYKLWNTNENEQALSRAVALARDPQYVGKLTKKERFKAINLEYRIALDLQNLDVANQAYLAMRGVDACASETAEAGFLLSLTYLGAGDAKRAWDIFGSQCDPDESSPNTVRRNYWTARIREANGDAAGDRYRRIIDNGVPGFYYFLSHARTSKPVEMDVSNVCTYRKAPLSVPSSVHELLNEAETSLKYHLRSDASVFLQAATQKLREGAGPNEIPVLLYIAHLFGATGFQLEAMKIYAIVTEIAQGRDASPVPFDFLPEMFPTPNSAFVSIVGREWKMDPDFVYAIIRQESAFNPGAVSPANARGLMQLMPFLGEQISKNWKYKAYYSNRTLFFARENLKFATYHLQQLQTQLPHPALIAAAYNAGAKRAATWWKRAPTLPLDIFVELIPVVETRNYVKLVLRNYVFYKLLRAGGRLDPTVVPLKLPEMSVSPL